jgi:hypothetical protein
MSKVGSTGSESPCQPEFPAQSFRQGGRSLEAKGRVKPCGAQLNIGFSGRQSTLIPARRVLLFGIKSRNFVAIPRQFVACRPPSDERPGVFPEVHQPPGPASEMPRAGRFAGRSSTANSRAIRGTASPGDPEDHALRRTRRGGSIAPVPGESPADRPPRPPAHGAPTDPSRGPSGRDRERVVPRRRLAPLSSPRSARSAAPRRAGAGS